MNRAMPLRLLDTARQRARSGTWMLVVELFLGLGWARAAGEKIIDVNWWTGDVLHEFLADHVPVTIGWYEPFLVRVVAPHVVLVAVTVVALQLFAGAALLTGRNRTAGLIIGMFLNLHFLAAGAVNPSAFYLLAQGAVLLAIAEASHARIETLLGTVKFVSGTSALVSVAFIRTLHPATVIDDPAAMFVTLGILSVLGCELVRWRRLAGNLGVDRAGDAGGNRNVSTRSWHRVTDTAQPVPGDRFRGWLPRPPARTARRSHSWPSEPLTSSRRRLPGAMTDPPRSRSRVASRTG